MPKTPNFDIHSASVNPLTKRGQAASQEQQAAWNTFDYEPDTGLLTWRVTRKGRYAKPGNEAGMIDGNGYVRVTWDGKNYAASRLIWFWMTGEWPEHRLYFRDGNRQNLRWNNIVSRDTGGSQTRTAIYQRDLRLLNERARQLIRESTRMSSWYDEDPKAALSEARDIIRQRIRQEAIDQNNGFVHDLDRTPGLSVMPKGLRRRRRKNR